MSDEKQAEQTTDYALGSDIAKVIGAGVGPVVRRLIEDRVAAERERCARIALRCMIADLEENDDYTAGANDAARRIAEAIQNG